MHAFNNGLGWSCDTDYIYFTINEENSCLADAGTLTATSTSVCSTGEVTISAHPNGDAFVPEDYSVLYVLTQGEGLVIQQVGGTPEFTVSGGGDYTIHTLVYPNGLDLSIVELGVTTGFDVNGLLIQGGGELCASLDVAGAPVHITNPDAGTLTADESNVALSGGSAIISATPNGDANVPEGYSTLYVLTQGESLTIVNVGGTPSFEVTEAGNYTIHTLVYPTGLDLSVVELGVTTGFDVNGLLVQGGGDLCASLDVPGAPIHVEEEACLAVAGTLTAISTSVCSTGEVTISAHPNGDAFVPEDYSVLYVLTQGEGLVIQQVGGTPEFTVSGGGDYTIHTLVYPNGLDLSIVELGVTTGFDVNGLLIQGGGELCASLDVAGAPVHITNPDAGTLTADESNVALSGGSAIISATPNGDANVPEGYSTLYALTQGESLTIVNVGGTPSFEVTEAGNYTIHTLVYPTGLDLSVVELGVTTGFDVNGLLVQGGGDLCASLDVPGAPIHVEEEACLADAGTLTAISTSVCSTGEVTISAHPNGDAFVPEDYSVLYVLTQGEGLVIQQVGGTPEFTVSGGGDYTIHTLVYPNGLDLSIVELGVTTGFDVNGLLIQGGGELCASLDVAGAPVHITNPDAGTLTADESNVALSGGSAIISATPNGDANVPEGYSTLYALTQGESLTIVNVGGTPSFEVTEAGNYTIHTLVYPTGLDLSVVELGVTTGFDVNGLLVQGGGDLCASLDVPGAPIHVEEEVEQCLAHAGRMKTYHPLACISGGVATVSAFQAAPAVIPAGYQQLYVLTNAFNLTILNVSATPEFEVNQVGFYRIHSLVYDPSTLDLSIVELGTTTAFDVLPLLQQGGGEICASLDVRGAVILALPGFFCNIFGGFYGKDGDTNSDTVNDWVNQYDSYDSFAKDVLAQLIETDVYPNPVRTELNINTTILDGETIDFSIIDMQGRLLQTGRLNSISRDLHNIDMKGLSNGTYIVQLNSEYRNFTTKVQVQR